MKNGAKVVKNGVYFKLRFSPGAIDCVEGCTVQIVAERCLTLFDMTRRRWRRKEMVRQGGVAFLPNFPKLMSACHAEQSEASLF